MRITKLLRVLLTGLLSGFFNQSNAQEPQNPLKQFKNIDFYKPLPAGAEPSSQQRFFAALPIGQQVFEPPEQYRIHHFEWHKKGNYQLGYTDTFIIRGLVLSRRHYHGDPKADIAPYDLVLGWQRMSDPAVIKDINIRQNNRFYYWRVDEFPIPRAEIELSSTNLHIVPDSPQIAEKLAKLKRGDVVSIVGYLTDVKDQDEFIWTTSRSRKDSGDGACEIVLVKHLSLIKQLKQIESAD